MNKFLDLSATSLPINSAQSVIPLSTDQSQET